MSWWFLRSQFRNFVNGVRWHRHHFDGAVAADNNKVHKTQNTASLCCAPMCARRTQSVLLTLYSSSTQSGILLIACAFFYFYLCFFVCAKCELQSGLKTGGKWMYEKKTSIVRYFFSLIQAVLCSDVAIFVLSFFFCRHEPVPWRWILFRLAPTGDCRLMGF